jgi:hypothetical protein
MMVPTFAILKLKYCTNHVALYMPRPRKCTANKHTGHPMTNLSLEEAHALQIYRNQELVLVMLFCILPSIIACQLELKLSTHMGYDGLRCVP